MVHQTFAVSEGLHCAACVSRMDAALRTLPGVAEVQVDLANRRVRIGGSASAQALVAHLAQHGFRVAPAAAGPATRAAFMPVAVALVLAAVGMGLHLLGLHHGEWGWVQVGLAGAALAGPGRGIVVRALSSLRRAETTMDTLVALGTGSAFVLAAAAAGGWVRGQVPVADASTMTVALVLFGRWLEDRAKAAAGDAVATLAARQPPIARLVVDGAEDRLVPVADLVPGDRVRIRPWDIVPVDGEVDEGATAVDESLLTGESVPVAKQVGSSVVGGSANRNGAVVARVVRTGSDTALARLTDLLLRAQATKPETQRLVDRIATVFVPVVVVLAALTFLLASGALSLVGQTFQWSEGILPAVTVLVVACPCALGLATPMALTVAVGRLARLGVFLATPRALEAAGRIDTILCDKTGTLTDGAFAVERVRPAADQDEDRLLAQAAAIAQGSEHPLALGIRCAALDRVLHLPPVDAVVASPGQGVTAELNGRRTLLGSRAWLEEHGIPVPETPAATFDGTSEVHLGQPAQGAAPARWLGCVHLRDQERPEAAQVVAGLRERGLRLLVASGDREPAVAAMAHRLGVAEFVAEAPPERKLALITRLRDEGATVALVGDGLNDAPALAAADLGIAPVQGTDVATTQADAILGGGDLRGILHLVDVARAARTTIQVNLFWAGLYNLVAIPAAMGLFGSELLSPAVAAGAMACSSLVVVGNSLRLRSVGAAGPPSILRQGFAATVAEPPVIRVPGLRRRT